MKITNKELIELVKTNNLDLLKKQLHLIFSDVQNIELFAQFFFSHIITDKIPKFHKEWYNLYFKDTNEVIAAPRGFGKSTVFGLVSLLHDILYKKEKYIVYVSRNHSATVKFLEPIKQELKENTLLRWVYGDLTPSRSGDSNDKDREDIFDSNGVRVEAVSFEKSPRGFKYRNMRPTKMIFDDIESDDRVINPIIREKDEDKFNRAFIPARDIKVGKIKMIGTILHINSLLSKKLKEWNGHIYRAIVDGKSIWPERFSLERLEEEKKTIGSLAFNQEYMNDPSNYETSIIKREWLIKSRREDLSKADILELEGDKFLGVDFAFSDRISADNSAFIGILKKDDYFYLFLQELKHGLSINEQLNHIRYQLQPKYKFLKIGLEENSIKGVSKDLQQYNLPLQLYWTGSKDQVTNNIKEIGNIDKSITVGKVNLIMRLATDIENTKIIIPYKTEEDRKDYERLEAELVTFSIQDGKLIEGGIHSDIGIGLGYAMELARNHNDVFVDFGDAFE